MNKEIKPMEENKIINGYDNYLIYNNGKIFNQNTKRWLKGSVSENGYLYYRLSKNGQKKMFYGHRLVAEHFIDNPNNLPVVNHKDGDKLNNNVSNLEWSSYSDNIKHAYDTNLIAPKKENEYYKEDLLNEKWKQYLDYDNYLISSCGRVRNIKTNRILKPSLTSGYLKVRLCKKGTSEDLLIHKLVYAIFNNEPYLNDRHFVIDHIDADKTNNNIDNLRKISNSENTLAAFYEQGVNSNIKAVQQYSLDGILLKEFSSIASAARELNLDSSSISKACRGKLKTCGGFIFKYK